MLALDKLSIHNLYSIIKGTSIWREYLEQMQSLGTAVDIHIAVLVEPFLALVLNGKKDVESRFSIRRLPPYQSIRRDDVILLKQSGGPIVGIARAQRIWFFEMMEWTLPEIRKTFAERLCASDDAFWAERALARYATLIELGDPSPITPVDCDKTDRRGWVTVHCRQFDIPYDT